MADEETQAGSPPVVVPNSTEQSLRDHFERILLIAMRGRVAQGRKLIMFEAAPGVGIDVVLLPTWVSMQEQWGTRVDAGVALLAARCPAYPPNHLYSSYYAAAAAAARGKGR